MLRLAVWSRPRNISTAMMRAWGNRADTVVVDEPLYAHYLRVTRLPHPGIDEVLAHHQSDWRKVAAALTGPVPEGKAIFYQKHMAHHLLPEIDRDWLSRLTHIFLIRDPKEMLTSLMKVLDEPRIEDTGLLEQLSAGVIPEPVLTASRGEFHNLQTEAVPNDVPGHWRTQFDLAVTGSDPVELRCFLRNEDSVLSETWLYQYHPTG